MSGFAPFGNFWNYYQFNKVEERLQYIKLDQVIAQILPGDRFVGGDQEEKLCVLDVGCNEGDLTLAVGHRISEQTSLLPSQIQMLGVDLDGELIHRAKQKSSPLDIDFQHLDFLNASYMEEYLASHQQERFDLVFALSITMWIHLNAGDRGLDEFLEKLARLSKNLIIEPHPWKCYLSMRKRNKKNTVPLPYNLDDLKIRNDVVSHIEQKLAQLGFVLVETLGTTKWERKLLWYKMDPSVAKAVDQ